MPFLRNIFSFHGLTLMGVQIFLFMTMVSGVLAGSSMFMFGAAYTANPLVKWWGWVFSISGGAYILASLGGICSLVYFFFSGNVKVIKYFKWYVYGLLGCMTVFTISGIGSGSTNAVGYLFIAMTATCLFFIVKYLTKKSTLDLINTWFKCN